MNTDDTVDENWIQGTSNFSSKLRMKSHFINLLAGISNIYMYKTEESSPCWKVCCMNGCS